MISFNQILGLVMGTVTGIVWEHLSTTQYKGFKYLFSSLFVTIGGRTIHVHHWPFYALGFFALIFWSWKTGRIMHPAMLMIFSAIISATIFYTFKFPPW